MRRSEPIINLPGVISGLLLLLIAIQFFVVSGPKSLVYPFYDALAFIPLRLSFALAPQGVLSALAEGRLGANGGQEVAAALGAGPMVYLTPLTYALLHGGWAHLGVNALTLAAFGAPVARRLGSPGFLAFFAACAAAGAMAHFMLFPFDALPVVGASAAISGTMAALARFAFAPGLRLDDVGARGPATAPLGALGENRQALVFVVVWLGANFLMGAFPEASGSTEPIAWEAHVGGFLFGLLTFGAFDHWARRRRP